MMIVEFCKYGNLSNYLRSKRADFIVYKVNHTLHGWDFPVFSFLIILAMILSAVQAGSQYFYNHIGRKP